MKDVIFDLKNVGVCYRKAAAMPWKNNKFWALKDVSFDVHRGETVGVIGRNGAGKSTLLKILADIIKPDLGTINRARVKVTMQSLGAGFEPRLTGRQNITLNGLLLGTDKSSMLRRVNEIVELADIGEFIDEPVKVYSSGMKARLGFAIAYYVDTDVILIDETLATGDQVFKAKASALIKEKIKKDYTVILVAHGMDTIRELCGRVIHIEEGRSLEELEVSKSVERYLGMKNKVLKP